MAELIEIYSTNTIEIIESGGGGGGTGPQGPAGAAGADGSDAAASTVIAGTGVTVSASGNDYTVTHTTPTFIGTPVYPTGLIVDALGHIQISTSQSTASSYRNAIGADDASNLASGTIAAARLPAISDSYTGQIETAADKTYTIDPRVAAARTISYFYGRSSTGTCTAKLYNGSDVVATLSVTSSSSTALLDSNYTAVSENGAITLVVSSNIGAENVVFAVEYTR